MFYFKKSYLRKFSTLPTAKLFAMKDIQNELIVEWAEMVKAKIQFFNEESMKVTPGCSDVALRHQAWVISQIKLRSVPKISAASLFKNGFVTKEALVEVFGEDII